MNKMIPNILTTLRMILVPFFIWIFYFKPFEFSDLVSLIIFVTAALTDYFDGQIARKYNIISNYGKVMDPLADKLLTGAAFIGLYLENDFIELTVIIIILLREISVSVLREVYARKKVFIPANNWGKIKTIMQMTGLTAALIYIAFSNVEQALVLMVFYYYFWLVALVTIFSGASYFLPLFFPQSSKEEK